MTRCLTGDLTFCCSSRIIVRTPYFTPFIKKEVNLSRGHEFRKVLGCYYRIRQNHDQSFIADGADWARDTRILSPMMESKNGLHAYTADELVEVLKALDQAGVPIRSVGILKIRGLVKSRVQRNDAEWKRIVSFLTQGSQQSIPQGPQLVMV